MNNKKSLVQWVQDFNFHKYKSFSFDTPLWKIWLVNPKDLEEYKIYFKKNGGYDE